MGCANSRPALNAEAGGLDSAVGRSSKVARAGTGGRDGIPNDQEDLAGPADVPGFSTPPRPGSGAQAAAATATAAAAGTLPHYDARQLSSLGSTDSDSEDADSEWDRYSWRQSGRAVPPSPGILSSRDTVASMTVLSSLHSQPLIRLRQDSLFGLTTPPLLSPVKDSGRLRLCKVSGCTFVNQYMVIKYLGRGSSGRVFLCMSIDDHRLYAVKIVKKDQQGNNKAARSGRKRDPLDDLRREIAVMRRSLHPNIVALREVVDDSSSNKMLLVMDYLEGGPVMTREGLERGHRVPEDVARLYFRDMCKALDYLHNQQRVVHGDLKPENALMGAGGRVALSDFGCSKVLAEDDCEFDRCNGTPAFLAPEMMSPNARYRGRPADVYALGGCLYSFVFGKIPFRADTVLQLFEVVQTTPVTFPDQSSSSGGSSGGGGGGQVSADLKQLLLGMLEKDPERRLTLAQVIAHPWITAGGALPPLLSSQQRRQPAAAAAAGAGATSAAACGVVPAFGGAGSRCVHSGEGAAAVASSSSCSRDGAAPTSSSCPPPLPVPSQAAQHVNGSTWQPQQQQHDAAQTERLAAAEEEHHWRRASQADDYPPQQQQEQQDGDPWQRQQQQQEEQQQEEEDPGGQQQQQLLQASLLGLVSGGLQVQAFAAGEHLMLRGQPGSYMMYILEGECEVHYRPAAPPEPPAAAAAAAAAGSPPPAAAGAAASPPPPAGWPAAAAAAGGMAAHVGGPGSSSSSPQQHSQQQQRSADATGSELPLAMAKRRSVAGILTPSCDGGGSSIGSSRPTSAETSAAAAVAAAAAAAEDAMPSGVAVAATAAVAAAAAAGPQDSTLGSSSVQGEAGGASELALYARRNSSYIAEAAAAAAEDLAVGSSARQLGSTGQQQQEQQAQQQPASGGSSSGGFSFPPPGSSAPQQQQQRRQQRQQQRLTIDVPLPDEPGTPTLLSATAASAASAAAVTAPPAASIAVVGNAAATSPGGTPPTGSPAVVAAAAAGGASAEVSPGPYGLRRHMSLDIEGASEQLYSPAAASRQLPEGTAAANHSARWDGGASAGPSTLLPAPVQTAGQRDQQQQQGAQLEARQVQQVQPEADTHQQQQQQQADLEQQQQPEVVGEELPPTLIEAAIGAQELLEGLRRGPRDYLVAIRGPGDFVGELEALGGSQSRRVASVVAHSSCVQAAVIPYAAAKAYLTQHPLAKQQLAQLMWLRQSENIVLEALSRLAALGDDMLLLLR